MSSFLEETMPRVSRLQRAFSIRLINIATVYMDGLKDFSKGEETTRLALDGYERSLGKDHAHTKRCARNFAILLGR